VNKVGGVVMLFPRDKGWEILVQSLDHFSEDFMAERDQGEAAQDRTAL
jgi:virulence-associated protein VagC